MNNETKNDAENKQNNSLMRKTKAQLVDIILRKDSIERSLRSELKKLNEDVAEAQDSYKELYKKYSQSENNYEDICDEKASLECELNGFVNSKNKAIRVLSIALAISAIFNVLLVLVKFKSLIF